MGGQVVSRAIAPDTADIAERMANARLIAAAPDLLVALQTIFLHAPSLDVTGIRELCDAALSKAAGCAA